MTARIEQRVTRMRAARDLDPPYGPETPKPDGPEIVTLTVPYEARLWDTLGEGGKVATRYVVDIDAVEGGQTRSVEFCDVYERVDPSDPETVEIHYREPVLVEEDAFPIVVARGMPLPFKGHVHG